MKIQGELSLSSIIHKLKHGYSILSHVKWGSVSGSHIQVVGLLGIAGLILALRDNKFRSFSSIQWFSESNGPLEKFWVVPGLRNLGNNCFLNVILQALASCMEFGCFLEKVILESQSSLSEDCDESMPLSLAFDALLRELSVVRDGRVVLDPQKVMVAMNLYIPKFNLANQQDAEEAFLLLLSCLRDEFSESFVPSCSSLADILGLGNSRIHDSKKDDVSEWKRWQHHYFGPFDGIICSILTCQSCSSQISLDFEFFHSLPLSPVTDGGGSIMAGCTLEDCLKRFVVAERVENYHCSNCWHLAATKYLSTLGRSETDVRKLMSCTRQDNCDCKHIAGVEAIPWSNNFSHTVKQLSIARCPKVICIHLQRAWMNYVGEPVKLQGHIDFPLCLDLHPYMKNGVGLKNSKDPGQGKHVKQQLRQRVLHTNYSLQLDSCLVNCTNILRGKNFSSGLVDADEVGSASTSLHVQEEACSFPVGKGYSEPKVAETRRDLERKMSANCTMAPVPVKSHTYHLVSVVEHFGRAGCGHYTVYRRVKDKPVQEDPAKQMKPFPSRWFCISDSEVFSVLEKDVLAVEASLLFYERIVELVQYSASP
ncbi:Peptidase C19, ubiquitin carboxyl-terminal hydrolase [Dillenia turbinata]|uniref:Ubiquitin carboxyl-terminal hydrolase n=1 Tax=Dillenia turbinata TaxID=194707 RepID=A0AAN8V3D5_9MAGN